MHGTKGHHRHHYRWDAEPTPQGPRPYWGWSHQNQRMEFMDFPSYMDSFRQGYQAAYGDLMTRAQQMGWPAPASTLGGPPPGSVPGPAWMPGYPEPGPGEWRHHRHEGERCDECGGRHHHGCEKCGGRHHDCDECGGHRHHGCEKCGGRHHDCDECGDRHHRDCRCDCCIVDADIIVYARCGELRVIPIEITNDTRKVRENVEVDVSDVRTSGGRVLPWATVLRPTGPLTLEPCSTTKLELGVHIVCGERKEEPQAQTGRGAAAKEAAKDLVTRLIDERDAFPDVDRCEVGYATVRVGGCLVRPIVVAIAVLPNECDTYRAGCSCSCCC
jgi:hypothetical protein